ncbi:MAG: epimerase, partial [Campylobacterales bacterium]|nr:epimerase [Campylobacterales bacterium]
MKVFISGATGFIGGELQKRLVVDEAEVLALVRNESVVLTHGVKQIVADLSYLSDVDAGFL